MNASTIFVQRHELPLGIALMFLLTWPIDLAHSEQLPLQVPFLVYLFLGWDFVIAAIVMTALTSGQAAVARLLGRFLIWRVGWRWFAVSLLLLPAIIAAAVFANAWINGQPLDFTNIFAHKIFGASASLPIFVIPFLLTDAISNGEEIGWRGYVLPRLQAHHNAFVASLILGVIWATWHVPKFLAPGNSSPFSLFFVRVVIEAVLYTWIYNNTQGSLLMTTLAHASANTAGVFLPVANTVSGSDTPTLEIQILIDAVIVIAVVAFAGPANLSRSVTRQTQL